MPCICPCLQLQQVLKDPFLRIPSFSEHCQISPNQQKCCSFESVSSPARGMSGNPALHPSAVKPACQSQGPQISWCLAKHIAHCWSREGASWWVVWSIVMRFCLAPTLLSIPPRQQSPWMTCPV